MAILLIAAAALLAAGVLWRRPDVSPQPSAAVSDPASEQFYTVRVRPILKSSCFSCHGWVNHRGGLRLDTRAGLARGGRRGSDVVPGHPEKSLLITLIRHEGPARDPLPMPPRRKLSDADIAAVTAWIKAGAIMPSDDSHFRLWH